MSALEPDVAVIEVWDEEILMVVAAGADTVELVKRVRTEPARVVTFVVRYRYAQPSGTVREFHHSRQDAAMQTMRQQLGH